MLARILIAQLLLATVASASPVGEAIGHFEQGEYEVVVGILQPLVDTARGRDPVETAQALRIYGIACVLTQRKLAAEGAFYHWLELEPRARLDPTLVRPDVVEFFDAVRARHRTQLVAEVEQRRPRLSILNLFPPVGQFQNGQKLKFGVLLGAELALLGVNLATGITLKSRQRDDGTFADETQAQQLLTVNYLSFGVLAGVLLYGIIDGFYHFYRLTNELEIDRDSLRASVRVRSTGNGLAVVF